MSAYLRGLLDEGLIEHREYQALAPMAPQSPDELYALTVHFHRLVAAVLPEGRLPRISALAARQTSQALRRTALEGVRHPLHFAKGASQPPQVPYPLGSQVSPSTPGPGGAAAGSSPTPAAPPLAPIDHHTPLRAAGWPARDQGQRGTCVAHAMAALKEAQAPAAGATSPGDRSEQFLFWAAKQFDPSPADGTLHGHALNGLRQLGLCDEGDWPYVPTPQSGSVHQGPPPTLALGAAGAALHAGGGVATASNAMALYQQLLQAPVAIGVPVFADPQNQLLDNWNVAPMAAVGRVAEPPPLSVVVGGHSVCVVGFEPDSGEPAGRGWFVIRNSWGTAFGANLPQGGCWGPEPGYGQISWSYVDNYLWEMCWL